jgi:hypothetical protein
VAGPWLAARREGGGGRSTGRGLREKRERAEIDRRKKLTPVQVFTVAPTSFARLNRVDCSGVTGGHVVQDSWVDNHVRADNVTQSHQTG